MAFSFNDLNAKKFNIDTTGFEYYSLSDLYTGDENDIFPFYGVYINSNGHYGDSPLLALEDRYLNLPKHLLNTAKEMRSDPEAIKAINDGKAGISIYKYIDSHYNKECYSVRWRDIKN